MRKSYGVCLALFLFGASLWAYPSTILQAQEDTPRVDVLQPVAVENHGSTLGVSVPFQLRDSDNQSVDDAQITAIELRLLDMPEHAIKTFQYTEAWRVETPLFISLVIDASGSMGPYIDAVRAAARTAVNDAPSNAYFRIVSFRGRDSSNNPAITIHQEYTADRGRILAAIDSIASPAGGTCYYDTVYESLINLDSVADAAGTSARRAIVAFTDGEDIISQTDSRPCSRRSIEELIQASRRTDIPIYTIGMYGTNPANIKADALRRLASETGGLAAIGSQGEIDELFEQVFAGLVNQYLADFEVLAKPGRNEAILTVQLRSVNGKLQSPPFEFVSPNNFIPPTPTPTRPATPTPRPTTAPPPPPTPVPTATVIPFTEVLFEDYWRDGEQYVFPVSLSNPKIVSAVYLVALSGSETIYQSHPSDVSGTDESNHEFRVDVSQFRPGNEYRIQVRGFDINGNILLKPQDSSSRAPTRVLAEIPLTPEVVEKAALEVEVTNVVELNERQLRVEFVTNLFNEVDKYRAIIKKDGIEQGNSPTQVFGGSASEIIIDKPQVALQPVNEPEAQEYELFLTLWTIHEEDPPATSEAYTFPLIPPKAPSLFDRVLAGLGQNPILAIGLVVVLSSAVLFVVFGRRPKKQAFSLARPVEEYTVVAGAAPANGKKRGKLLIEVVETPSAGDKIKRTVSNFPCVIGRSQECQIRLTGDGQISRQHARLAVENGRIILTDMGSNNGTFVEGQRISANAPTTLSDAQVFQLGRHTKIRVSLQY